MSQGKKTCPNCNTEIGVRTHLCGCGWHYPSGEVRKDLLEAKNAKPPKSMGQGKKECPNCKIGVGVRTHLCECGWHFPSGSVRKNLLKKKKVLEKNKTYTCEGRGRKRCPGCNLIIGGVSKTCFNCNFDFVSAKKEKDEVKAEKEAKKQETKENVTIQGEKISPTVAKLLQELGPYKESERITPKEHAEKILSKGKVKALFFLKHAKTNHCWGHVDWDIVEQGVV